MRNAGYTDVERGERGSTEEHLTVTQFKVQREQERLDTLTAQADQQAQSLAKTCQTLSKDVQPYLDAMRHAPERVRNFFENLLARRPERTADAPSKASRQKNAEL